MHACMYLSYAYVTFSIINQKLKRKNYVRAYTYMYIYTYTRKKKCFF